MGLFGLFGKKKAKGKATQCFTDPEEVEIALDEALEAYEAGDFSTALEIYLELAEHGNAEAQFYCGEIYCHPDIPEEDQEKGLSWYKKAAAQGESRAKYIVDSLDAQAAAQKAREDEKKLLQMGLEAFDQDNFEAAIEYLEPLAEKGSLHAQFFCGLAHDEISRSWAAHLLDEKYDREAEWDKALRWYEKVINSGDEKWKEKLFQIMKDRIQGEERMRLDETRIPEKVLFLMGKQGDAQALYDLGRLYENHILNFARAYQCYEMAAARGNVHAQLRSGAHYYQHGAASEDDLKKALYWYHKAAENRSPAGCFYCGLMLYNGEGTAADRETAKFLIEKAADQSFTEAKQFLRSHSF